jgi:hypothetical protein
MTMAIRSSSSMTPGDTLAPVLFLCYIQAVPETLFPKFEAAGIEKMKLRSMQPKPAVDGELAAGSLMVKPAVFHSSICNAPSLPKSVIVHTGNCRSYELPEAVILVCATRSPSPADWGPGTV